VRKNDIKRTEERHLQLYSVIPEAWACSGCSSLNEDSPFWGALSGVMVMIAPSSLRVRLQVADPW
jgi:hypothetical protein